MMKKLNGHVWQYDDADGCTSFLIAGQDRACMIDCGMGRETIMPLIREVTNLPVDLLLTHAHYDHYGAAKEFECIFLSEADFNILPEMERIFGDRLPDPMPTERLISFAVGACFDLGGCVVRALPLPGHTPGSVVFADERDEMLFTGDALGSGQIVLMSVPYASNLRDYLSSLEEFIRLSAPYRTWQWYGGHMYQAGVPGTVDYNPPSYALAVDMAELCRCILSGQIVGNKVAEINAPEGTALRAFYRSAGIVYTSPE